MVNKNDTKHDSSNKNNKEKQQPQRSRKKEANNESQTHVLEPCAHGDERDGDGDDDEDVDEDGHPTELGVVPVDDLGEGNSGNVPVLAGPAGETAERRARTHTSTRTFAQRAPHNPHFSVPPPADFKKTPPHKMTGTTGHKKVVGGGGKAGGGGGLDRTAPER